MARTVCEELVYRLGEYGVKQIFGITGDALNPFTDAIRRDGRMSWYTVRHEEIAAFAVAAQAEVSGELSVCAGTVGPGALHLVNGLYNAKRDHAPVLAITGHIPRIEAGGRYFQEVDIEKAFEDVCVFRQTLRSPDQVTRVLQQAIEASISQRGVSHIAIPTDLSNISISSTDLPLRFVLPGDSSVPDAHLLDEAAAIINGCDNVAMLIGCGCRGARDSIISLAEKIKAPVAHSLKGSEVLPFDHPHSIGGVGHVGTPHGLKVLENHDLLLMIGTDFPYSAFLPSHGNVIQIDCRAMHIGTRCPIALGLIGHAGPVVNALLPRLKTKNYNSVLTKLQEQRDHWIAKIDEKFAIKGEDKIIHPQSVVLAVSRLASDDAVFVGDVGEVTVWVARHLRMRGRQQLIGSFNHGSLGVGLPAAIGVKARYPDRQVIALCGDGAYGMVAGDFVTAVRYQWPIIVIVFNNGKFGFVELEMEASGLARFATDLVNPDFAMMADAAGGKGITVKHPAELEESLELALQSEIPVLLDVHVNPHELILPPKIEAKTAWKFLQGKVREMFIEKDLKVLFER